MVARESLIGGDYTKGLSNLDFSTAIEPYEIDSHLITFDLSQMDRLHTDEEVDQIV